MKTAQQLTDNGEAAELSDRVFHRNDGRAGMRVGSVQYCQDAGKGLHVSDAGCRIGAAVEPVRYTSLVAGGNRQGTAWGRRVHMMDGIRCTVEVLTQQIRVARWCEATQVKLLIMYA